MCTIYVVRFEIFLIFLIVKQFGSRSGPTFCRVTVKNVRPDLDPDCKQSIYLQTTLLEEVLSLMIKFYNFVGPDLGPSYFKGYSQTTLSGEELMQRVSDHSQHFV